MAKEICDDMFAVLDKKSKGYVTPAEWINHFYPQRPGKKALPEVGVDDVFGRKQMEVAKTETPRIPDDLRHILHDVYRLWTLDAPDGILTRSQLLKTLGGPIKGSKQTGGTGLTWKEAEEATDGLFPDGRTEMTFREFANYFQDVLSVPYTKVVNAQSPPPPLPQAHDCTLGPPPQSEPAGSAWAARYRPPVKYLICFCVAAAGGSDHALPAAPRARPPAAPAVAPIRLLLRLAPLLRLGRPGPQRAQARSHGPAPARGRARLPAHHPLPQGRRVGLGRAGARDLPARAARQGRHRRRTAASGEQMRIRFGRPIAFPSAVFSMSM